MYVVCLAGLGVGSRGSILVGASTHVHTRMFVQVVLGRALLQVAAVAHHLQGLERLRV